MSYPPPPAPKNWFARLSPIRRVGVIFGAVLVLCCGGAIGFAALLPGGDGPKDRPAALVEPAAPVVTDPAAGEAADADASAAPTTAPAAAPTTAPPQPTPKPVSYANCTAVRAAGKAPLRKGQPGYRAALDADGDGVACETATRANGGDAPNPPPKPKVITTEAQPRTDPRFGTCKEAKAHGYGPYVVGETEYSWYRDADNDGKVCE